MFNDKTIFLHLSSATWLFTEKHVYFTTPYRVSFSGTWHYGYQSDFVQILVVFVPQRIQ